MTDSHVQQHATSTGAVAPTFGPGGVHLYLDSADLTALRTCLPHPVIHGITTNPTLARRAGLDEAGLLKVLESALRLGVRQVQAQVVSADVDGMLADARRLTSPFDAGQLVVKIPATRDGLRAGSELIAGGVPVTFTAVYALEQALFAAHLGAAYAAPYLGRMDDAGRDGMAEVARMQALLTRHATSTRLLVASVRHREAFLGLLDLGVGAVTMGTALMAELLDHPATLDAERGFLADAAASSIDGSPND